MGRKIEINVGKNKDLNTQEDVEAKDVDTLKKFLSKHYEIDKGIIERSGATKKGMWIVKR